MELYNKFPLKLNSLFTEIAA